MFASRALASCRRCQLSSNVRRHHKCVLPSEHSMLQGSCLCGAVQFEVEHVTGPFELCHCKRCRKASGSAFAAGLRTRRDHFHLLKGRELAQTYQAPIRESPPPYRACFCSRCGSPLPDITSDSPWLEIPAGLLDNDPNLRPDKHIFVEAKAAWFAITDSLPQLDKLSLARYRQTHDQA